MSAVPVPLPEEAASPPAPSGPRLGALQQRDFRLLWLGMVASQTGSWMQQITQNWLLWELTRSPLMLGLYGLCRSVPFIACSLYAGALADRVDRRRLLILTNCVNATFPLAVGALVALGRVEPWHIYLAACCSAVVDSFDLPARQALIPALVPRDQLMGALALTSSIRRATGLIGPSLGGVVVVVAGAAGAFFLNGAGFLAVVAAAVLMRARVGRPTAPAAPALTMVREGLSYVVHHRLLGTMMGVEALVTICNSYQAILPLFADTILDVGPAGLGLLASAPGLGAVLGSAGLVSRGDVRNKGRLMLVSGALLGVAMIGFAWARVFALSLVALVAVGFFDVVYGAVRNTIVQMAAPDRFRGRVMSLHTLTNRGLGPGGNFVTGGLAAAIGAPAALTVLAVASVVLVVWRGLALPALRDFEG
ncbi:MAG TPA: MFS transporter [Chloroflexota bacterium]|nr:MFS transporter [Chloroflexota bacterium]